MQAAQKTTLPESPMSPAQSGPTSGPVAEVCLFKHLLHTACVLLCACWLTPCCAMQAMQEACKVKLLELPGPSALQQAPAIHWHRPVSHKAPCILPLAKPIYQDFVKLYKECMLRNFKSNKRAAETYNNVIRLQQKVQHWKDKMCNEDDADMIQLIQKKAETTLGEYTDQMRVFQDEDVWEVHTMFNEFCSVAGCLGLEFEDLQQPCSASLDRALC